uniref:Uncharacterized protein n=1 Tax=Ditylenchus dipsaci TaxID=166011 RepID=A0A915DCK0_9BILA
MKFANMKFAKKGHQNIKYKTKWWTSRLFWGIVNGTGDLSLSGAGNVYKTIDGIIGANGTSVGNSTANGTSSILSNAYGNVGTKTVQSQGSVDATGNNTKTSSLTYAGIDGNNTNIQNRESGSATGVGNTNVNANGAAYMANGNMTGGYNGNQTIGQVGATGDKASSSSLAMSQSLSWGTILAQLLGTAVAQGYFNATAAVDLAAGTAANGIEVNGLVQGKSAGGGLVSAQVIGGGNMNGNNHSLTGDLAGSVNGAGGSNLVGASNLQSNGSTNNGTINSFGEGIINTNGKSSLGMLGNTSVGTNGNTNGEIIMQGAASGTSKNMTINDGLKTSDGKNTSAVRGIGNLVSAGNVDTNATVLVDTNQDWASGKSAGNNNTQSMLGINNIGQFIGPNANKTLTSDSNASGLVNAETSDVTGNAFMDLTGLTPSGNSSVEAKGGGKGSSSAQTGSLLNLVNMNNELRNTSIHGSVNAKGDLTKVNSLSMVSDTGGRQTLFNSQNATVDSARAGSASASASGVL